MLGRGKHNRPVIAQIDVHSGFEFDLLRKLGIHAGAGGGEGLESGSSFYAALHQHAAGGVGSLAARLSALDDENAGAAPAQGQGEREPYDAASDDDYVPNLHLGIVKERRLDMG